ncbi:MAG TPA: hypothetical protein VHO67_00545 [Polyangia bacterium]|nr:hypothetical protein [Polyangia bacterium]
MTGRFSMAAALALLAAACSSTGAVSPGSPRHDAGTTDVAARDDAAGGASGHGDAAVHGDASGADGGVPGDCALGPGGEPTELRCTGLYADWKTKTLAPGVRTYDPGLHLWSDGASKTRWIYLPPGTKIDTSNMDQWSFPKGTKVWKEFVVNGVRLETRLIWKRPTGSWYMTTYRWSADGSRTDELTTGEPGADAGSYEIPTQNNCFDCHSGRRDAVLGFEAVALSSSGASGVTMATLKAENLLTDPPAAPLVIPGDAKAVAALGYLHMNCGTSCHNRDNSNDAVSSGLFLRLDVATLGSVQSTDTWTTGMNVTASHGIPGVADSKELVPCDVASSTVYYRMSVRDGVGNMLYKTQMPPIASHQVDQAALATVAAWLNAQPSCSSTAKQ